ncbi:MAG: ATP-binding cassette domain-containing protein [Lachnospiraceae bacterium]|nr:ATP-binding cassette domain-containing protein [Lachnospiraceae bacterium]
MNHNKQKKNKKKDILQKGIIILFWLCVWQILTVVTDNNILLVGPIQAGKAFLHNLSEPYFWKIVLFSLLRIGLGFFLALFIGIFLGVLAYKRAFIEMLFEPLMATLKSIPVVSFVVLLLIWFGSVRLSFFISFIVVLPNIYVNTVSGLKSTDKELLEMAEVFHIGHFNRFLYIYRPALMPYLISALKISLGMSWKSGVAAEVIGMPQYSLGERLYISKIYLDTAGLFSWTLTVIILSFAFEKAVLYIVKCFDAWNPAPIRKSVIPDSSAEDIKGGLPDIELKGVCKSYGGQKVIDDFSYTIKRGEHYCLTAPSGAGKTTLLKLINRIEQPERGTVECGNGHDCRIGMVFQEDRLCGKYNTITNVMITAKESLSIKDIYEEAAKILPKDCLEKPVSELSGGMKRRCAILRAMLSESEIIIMDEPFNGLDKENREKTAAYILERSSGKTLLVTTHRAEDMELMGGVKIEL